VSAAELVWFVMGGGVVAYALTGGADFGGGIWHLFARGPTAARDRRAVEHAIAPIWEANHVWLIFVVVIMFTAFPIAFSVVSVSLHVPITLLLLGIVLRGASFVFHAYDLRGGPLAKHWSSIFGVSSLLTPLLLGDILGALSTGDIRAEGALVTSGFFAGWLTPFAIGSGALAACLFALLAAVYLAAETEGGSQQDFRRRALSMELVAFCVALAVLLLSRSEAPGLFSGLVHSPYAIPVQLVTALFAAGTVFALTMRSYRIARLTVAAQVASVLVGWGLAMHGAIVLPDVRWDTAGVRIEVLSSVVPALGVGVSLVVPALLYLFRVFKRAE
jgi:cytochrome d ubiquinol oxidase subunit II